MRVSPGKYVDASMDHFSKMFTNQADVTVKWVGDTSKTSVTKNGPNRFYSMLGQSFVNNTVFKADQFHFHAGSEHTIEGERQDLEMHTVNFPEEIGGSAVASALGVFFSVSNYDKSVTDKEVAIIDGFFDSLKWEVTSSDP